MPHTVYLGFGSNLGDRRANILRASDLLLSEGLKPAAFSSLIETDPVGFLSPHAFLNAAGEYLTALTPAAVLAATQRVERALGRRHKSVGGVYADRPIDIDILFYDDLRLSTPTLTIPHPLIAERRFVLEPLAEISPGMRHPLTLLTPREMLENLEKRGNQ